MKIKRQWGDFFLSGLGLMAGLVAGPLMVQAAAIDNLQPGVWTAVSNNSIASVNPCPGDNCSYSGISGQKGLINEWSSGAYAANLGQYGSLLVWGGGHGQYLGNEVYRFDIASGNWSRLTEPTSSFSLDYSNSELANGVPMSMHSGSMLEYDPATSRFLKLTSASDHVYGEKGTGTVHMLDVNTRAWSRAQKLPGHSGAMNATSTAYDPTRKVVWLHPNYSAGSAVFSYFSPASGTWTAAGTQNNMADVGIYGAMAVDPTRDIAVLLDTYSSRDAIYVYALSEAIASKTGPYSITVTGAGGAKVPSALKTRAAFQWDSVNKVFVGWGTGSSVWTLTPPSSSWKTGTWTWKNVTAASGSASPQANSNGTFGRFRYVPALAAFIVVNDINSPVYMYKLSSAAGSGGSGNSTPATPPTVTLAASPSSLSPGGVANLDWSSTDATSCTASGGWSGAKATAGAAVTTTLSATTTFTLTCTGDGGTASASQVVQVVDNAPVINLTASPASVSANGSTTLNWSVSNATSCTASGGWSGAKSLSGSQGAGPLA
ncbi:MAG: hypothetical protein KJ041_03515, partial [Gammaproteobacteria bacterium]|nr:hypothetical protein [Gammaproteobacteria bacterium]